MNRLLFTLNNSKAQLRQQTESIVPAYAVLKQTMGCPPGQQFNIAFDTVQMMQEITFDTTQLLQYGKTYRISATSDLKNCCISRQIIISFHFFRLYLPYMITIMNMKNNSFPRPF